MRLIDADAFVEYIEDDIEQNLCLFNEEDDDYDELCTAISIARGFIAQIEKRPTVEAKPVVHCKDCEHWGTGVAGETEHVKCCEYGKYMVGENGYCCYADMRKKVE